MNDIQTATYPLDTYDLSEKELKGLADVRYRYYAGHPALCEQGGGPVVVPRETPSVEITSIRLGEREVYSEIPEHDLQDLKEKLIDLERYYGA